MKIVKGDIGDMRFGRLIQRLQSVTCERAPHEQVEQDDFRALRQRIADALGVPLTQDEKGSPNSKIELSDLEIGDVESSVLLTTLQLYPKETKRESIIDYSNRVHWCERLIFSLDTLVVRG